MVFYLYYPLQINSAAKAIVEESFRVNLPGHTDCRIKWKWDDIHGRYICDTKYSDVIFMAAHRLQKRRWEKRAEKEEVKLDLTNLLKTLKLPPN